MKDIVNVEVRTCEVVVAEIKATISSVNQTAILGAIAIGKNLQELKSLVPHGEWGGYIDENLKFSERKAQQFMQIADNYGDENSEFYKLISNPNMCADLSFSNALRLLALPEEEIETFVEAHDVSNLKVQELEEEIRKLKKSASEKANIKELEALQKEKAELIQKVEKLESEQLRPMLNTDEIDNLTKEIEKKKKEEEKLKEKIKAIEKEKQAEIEKAKESVKAEAKDEAEKSIKDKIKAMETAIDEAENRAINAEKKLVNLSNEDFANFKVKVTILQETFNDILDSIDNIKKNDEEQSDKLLAALNKLMNTLIQRL